MVVKRLPSADTSVMKKPAGRPLPSTVIAPLTSAVLASLFPFGSIDGRSIPGSSIFGASFFGRSIDGGPIGGGSLGVSFFGASTLGGSMPGSSILGSGRSVFGVSLGVSFFGGVGMSMPGTSTLGVSTLGRSTFGRSTLGRSTLGVSTLGGSFFSSITGGLVPGSGGRSSGLILGVSLFFSSITGGLLPGFGLIGSNGGGGGGGMIGSPFLSSMGFFESTSTIFGRSTRGGASFGLPVGTPTLGGASIFGVVTTAGFIVGAALARISSSILRSSNARSL